MAVFRVERNRGYTVMSNHHLRNKELTLDHNPVRDTITKFGKQAKTPDPYTPLQMKTLMDKVTGTEWEMLIVLERFLKVKRA